MQITIIFGISVHFYRNKQEPAGKPSLQACARNLFFSNDPPYRLIPFSYGGNGHSQSSQNPQNLAELNGFLAFFQVHDEPPSRTGHSCQIILAQFLSSPCFPHDPAQIFSVFLSWYPYLVTARYHYMAFNGRIKELLPLKRKKRFLMFFSMKCTRSVPYVYGSTS